VSLAVLSSLLGAQLWRNRRTAALLRAQLEQRTELQRRVMEALPSDQVVYPHARAEVGYVLNPFLQQGTLWAPKGRPYPINSWGLRGAPIGRKPPGHKRVVIVGDSWFFGWQLPDEERLESHVRALVKDPAYEIVTVAIPGWNVRSEAAFLESRMEELDPDALLWEICPNDIWDVGGVIPPGGLTWAFSPQNRNPDQNAFTVMRDPLPMMPFVLDRHRGNVALMERVRSRYGIPVLVAPVDLPREAWAQMAGESARTLPAWFIPQVYASDRTGWTSAQDSHPNPWMNARLAVGYVARLARMGALPAPALDAAQQAMAGEWDRANAAVPSSAQVDAYLRAVMDEVPTAYDADDLTRVAAGVDEQGRAGRRGLLYLRAAAPAAAVVLEFDVPAYAARFAREVKVSVRTFERAETSATTGFSAAAQRVTGAAPAPAGRSAYPVLEVEWLFNAEECWGPTECAAGRLVRAYTR